VEVGRDKLSLPIDVVSTVTGDQSIGAYCTAEGLPILMHVPLVEALPRYRTRFTALWERLEKNA
jgi:hypothetical protein